MTLTRLLDADLIRAAEILEREAAVIFLTYVDWSSGHNVWKRGSADKKAEHFELRRIARRFRRVVGRL